MLAPVPRRRPADACCSRTAPVAADDRRRPVTRGDAARTATAATRSPSRAPYVLDATETGDLLPLAGTEYVTGFESQADTGEPSAPADGPAAQHAGRLGAASRSTTSTATTPSTGPRDYDFWRDVPAATSGAARCSASRRPNPRTLEIAERSFTPNPDDDPLPVEADQRKTARRPRTCGRSAASPPGATSRRGAYASDITPGELADDRLLRGPDHRRARGRAGAPPARRPGAVACRCCTGCRPRRRAPTAAPASRACGCAATSPAPRDGLARRPTSASRRRIRAVYTVVEQDLSHRRARRPGRRRATATRSASACTASTCTPRPAATTTSTSARCPFEIPLGALLPRRVTNLLPAGKNIGTTHITNGCYRLHPVEWNIGEAAGALAAHLPRPRHARRTRCSADAGAARRLPGRAGARRRRDCAGPTSRGY